MTGFFGLFIGELCVLFNESAEIDWFVFSAVESEVVTPSKKIFRTSFDELEAQAYNKTRINNDRNILSLLFTSVTNYFFSSIKPYTFILSGPYWFVTNIKYLSENSGSTNFSK